MLAGFDVAELVEAGVALPDRHLTRHVTGDDFAGWALVGWHPRDDVGEFVGECGGGFDAGVEGDDSAEVVVPDRFRESDVGGECLGIGRDAGVGFDEVALLDQFMHPCVVDADDDDLVVGEQASVDGVAEVQSMKDRPNTVWSSIDATSMPSSSAFFTTRDVNVRGVAVMNSRFDARIRSALSTVL